ncbi:efflux RND transporter permease subunit [Aureibacter tunicatorum]|uniref:Hydrophobe/amphiphile efflux-1 (HAE1) family protein n=1 Tax=Aureibacter tunicatorum TaxID=866807 RepID=A0AAE3XRM7_9BACT|nr:multidrug efflux RND transporter permease subunit [Aureibacter tunicatorum]MDR6240199.1 hydrophobe/amphiphile efflux-1 (HAE1) family protein [Aureibacter tunicatorum]BDD05920.1 multidrug efflux RND transporter permease subunit [Aureibacter tunicatorum]
MNSEFFIDRPIFSIVLSIIIVLLGVMAIFLLPIAQYPDITPPVVKISTSYPGANAKVVSEALATPIEQELNGTPNMIYMDSRSTNTGGLNINITFKVGTDPDIAAIEVQNRVKRTESRLPAEVVQNGINIEKQSPSRLMTVCLQSNEPKYDEIYLSNFATINVLDALKRIPGVGRVSNVGSRYYGMRIWVQPDKLASYGLTIKDLQSAIKDQNRESAAGELGIPPINNVDVALPITAEGRLEDAEEFENIIVKAYEDGSIIRVRDVARVELAASNYRNNSELDGQNAAMLDIFLLPDANAIEVSEQIKEKMNEISKNFPEGIVHSIPFDTTIYISESIEEVYKTLFEALVLVVLVVYLSLQSWRSTLVPTIAVPISLIGTFAVMLAFGFSINMLTLLGLILAIGIVVDDAIVVVENVERLMEEEKLSPYAASHKAMKELSGAIVATSLVLAAVFLPVSFLEGITGRLFQQFSITIAVSVLISTVVALTLSPALCAIILKPREPNQNIVFRSINQWVEKSNNKYTDFVKGILARKKHTLTSFFVIIVLIVLLGSKIPTSFIPVEDQGFFNIELALPKGATLERTSKVADRAIKYLTKHPAIAHVQSIKGSSNQVGTNESRALFIVILKPWEERKDDNWTVQKVMEDCESEFYNYPEAIAYISLPPVIPGLGNSGGFEFQLQDKTGNSWDNLVNATDTLMKHAQLQKALSGVSNNMQTGIPQLYFDLDRDRAKLLGTPLADIFSTMKAFLGSVYVNDFNKFNRIYRVFLQADQEYREHPSDLQWFHVKANNGTMIPLTALGTTNYTTGPGSIDRFNLFTSTTISGTPGNGYSSGQAMDALETLAEDVLPENIGFEWSGLSYQEKEAEGQMGPILTIVLLFVFLFLAAQYESWLIPIAVLLSLPIAVLGAFVGIWFRGLENDIYFQIGLVTLIGLSAKNAILIVEFAKEKQLEGYSPAHAAVEAVKLRFRPIVMTSFAFILGMIPLVLASGAGSASRHSIGTGVFVGMIASTLIGIVFIPFFYVLINDAKEKLSGLFKAKPKDDES